MYLSVIIPAYNEGDRIKKTLGRVLEWLRAQDFSWEVLVVSDGSRDNTADLARQYADDDPRVRLVDNKENNGKGFVVRQGMLEAKGDIRLFTDADNSTDISYFAKMRPYFEKGYDVVISSRDSKDVPGAAQKVKQQFVKRFAGNVGNVIIQILLLPGIWDTQNGFKAFTREAAHRIFSHAKLNRWAFDVEILALARRFNYRIGIIPIVWINDSKSHVKMSAYFQFFLEVLKVRWWFWTNKYNNFEF